MANEKRLIDAYTLAEEIESLTITVAGKPAKWNDAKHSVLRILAEQPDVDCVEVVRCRDCKHRGTDYCIFHIKGEPADEELLKKLDNDFCSYGERKDNEH